MPLSDLAQKSFNESQRISDENQAKRKAQADQEEKERIQAEIDYNAFIAEQAEIQKQIDTLETQEKEYNDLVAQEEQNRQNLINNRNAVSAPYISQIAELQAQKAQALNDAHTSIWGGTGSRNRTQYNDLINNISKNYNTEIDKISREHKTAVNNYEYSQVYGSRPLQGSIARDFANSGGQLSLVQLTQKKDEALENKKAYQRDLAIAQSAGRLSADKAKLKNIVSSYQYQKEQNTKTNIQAIQSSFKQTPTKAGDLKEKATPPERVLNQPTQQAEPLNIGNLKSYLTTQQAKTDTLEKIIQERPKPAKPNLRYIPNKSNAFLTKPPPPASSIISKTTSQSDKSLNIYEQAQKLQKELFNKITNAKTSQEATKLKEQYQNLNPYVGTPQTARTKEGLAEQGILIDLKHNFKKDELINPGETITTYEIQYGDRTFKTTDKELADKLFTRFSNNAKAKTITIPGEKITTWEITQGDKTRTFTNERNANRFLDILNRPRPITEAETATEYTFQDKDGKAHKPTIAELWGETNTLINTKAELPNKKDYTFNKILKENPQAFSFDPNLPSGKTKEINIKTIYEEANKDPVNRGALNIIANPSESIGGKGIEDIIAVGESSIYNKPMPVESQAVKSFTERNQNDFKPSFQKVNYEFSEGQKELVGEALGEYGLTRFFGGAPAIITKVYETQIISPKTIKIAEEIAEKIRIGGRDPATEKFINQFPGMTLKEKEKLRSMTNKETVGLEQLDPRTVLIKRGTELSEVDTPYIIVKNTGKNKYGETYSIYTGDKPGAYSKLLIEGKTNKVLIEINTADLSKQNKLISKTEKELKNSKFYNSKQVINKLREQKAEKARLEKEISILSTKELNGGVTVADDLTQYPATRFNVNQVKDNPYLAKVGTSERVGIEGLRETPLAVIEKIETQQVKTGTLIHETTKRDPIQSMNLDSGAKELRKGEKNTDWTIPPTPTLTKIIKTFTDPPGNKIDLNIPGTKTNTEKSGNTITTGQGSNVSTYKQKKDAVERTIRAGMNKDKIDTSQFNKLSSISLSTSTQATRSQLGSSLGSSSQLRTEGKTLQAQFSQTKQAQQTTLKTEIETANKLRSEIITKLNIKLETTQKQKPFLNPRYSLITKPGLTDKQDLTPITGLDQGLKQDPGLKYELVTKQTTILKIPTPTRTTTRTTFPRPPGIPLSLDFNDEKETRKKKQGAPSISFFRYNTNTESVGRYIEQAPDISTGKTRKVIDKIDRLEKRINTPQYAIRETQRESRQYKKEQNLNKTNYSLNGKSFIPNISKPRGEKANKALKKFSFEIKF